MKKTLCLSLAFSVALAGYAFASDKGHAAPAPRKDNMCIGSGPQAPRDIDMVAGSNPVTFAEAPAFADMDMCNIHFHWNAEHKAAAYSTFIEAGDHSGWACQAPVEGRTSMEHVEYNGCQGITEGDTVEVHYVYTSCELDGEGIQPAGGGLSACMTSTCANPQLRVAAQVFVLAKDGELKFEEAPLPHNDPRVVYAGSTTGTSYSNTDCSPYQVTWDVKTTCATLDIDSFAQWCSNNKYNDNHAHGVRELVTPEKLLSKIVK